MSTFASEGEEFFALLEQFFCSVTFFGFIRVIRKGGVMKESIESIYRSYFNDLYRFLLSLCHDYHTAEDLVQETFLRAHLYVEHYDDERIKSWLFTVAHNVFIDHIRRQKRLKVKPPPFFFHFFDKRQTVEEKVVLDEEILHIIQQLEGLSEKQKYAVLLVDFHDLSYVEAAEVMQVTIASLKVSLYRGRQAIRKKKDVREI